MSIDLWGIMFAIVEWIFVDLLGGILHWLGLHGIATWLGRADVLNVGTVLLTALIFLVVGMLVSIQLIWQDRKMMGRGMDRRGTMIGPFGLFQNFADAFKVLAKEHIVPKDTDSLVYNIAPVLIIGVSIAMFATITYSTGFYMSDSDLSVILTLALFAVIPLSVLLGSWASNNKYTLIGGMRATAQTIAYEIPMLMAVVGVVIITGSLSFNDIVVYQQQNTWLIIPQLLGFFIFLISMIAEVERVPFDLPEAEAELVEGWQTEYGGMRFGLIMMSEYARAFVASSMIALLFLGGWDGPFLDWMPEGLWFLLKVIFVFGLFVWMRLALPRVRTDQILRLNWKWLLPIAVINILIAVILKTLGWF